jgi:hypothetical protein
VIKINNLKEEIVGTIGIVLIAVIVVLMISFILMISANSVLFYFGIRKLNFTLSCFIVLAVIMLIKIIKEGGDIM